jgi:hypothetical protein
MFLCHCIAVSLDTQTKQPFRKWSIRKRPKLKKAHHETAQAQNDPRTKQLKAQKRPKLKTAQGMKQPKAQKAPILNSNIIFNYRRKLLRDNL